MIFRWLGRLFSSPPTTNQDHIRVVQHGSLALEMWRKCHPNQRLLICGGDFRELDLKGIQLVNVDMREARFDSADLRGGMIANADARKSSFRNAKLAGSRLIRVNFRNADLSGASFG